MEWRVRHAPQGGLFPLNSIQMTLERMMRRYVLSVAVSLIASAASSTAMAQAPAANPPAAPNNGQAPAQNQVTKNAQFGDWSLVCRKADPQAAQTCELVQSFTLNGQKAPFAQIAIGKPKAEMPIQLTVVVPNNVSFPSSVKIGVDEKDKAPLDIAWARCLPMGCFANATLKDDTQKKWSALETQGRVVFKAGNGQDVVMPISFKGLKDALNALSNEK
jgi:invasion protein IalB